MQYVRGVSLLPTLYHKGVLGKKQVEEKVLSDCGELCLCDWTAVRSIWSVEQPHPHCELQEIQPDSNSLEIWPLEETYSACNMY